MSAENENPQGLPTSYECVWVTAVGNVKRYISRTSLSMPKVPCVVSRNPQFHHFMEVRVEDGPLVIDDHGRHLTAPREWPRDDHRWPAYCVCGYQFIHLDPHKDRIDVIYKAQSWEKALPFSQLPPGSMLRVTWEEPDHVGEDGMSVGVVLPNNAGLWLIDSSVEGDENPWKRTGTIPTITVDQAVRVGNETWILESGVLIRAA